MATRALVSYIVLAAFAAVLAILSCSGPAEGLTAFGGKPASSDKNKSAPSVPAAKPKSKQCTSNDECSVANTACKLDNKEGRKHCVCPDNSAPDNGACKLKGLAPGQDCSTSKCAPGSECYRNSTNQKSYCICEEGFKEDNVKGFRFCSGFDRVLPHTPSILCGIATFSILRTLLQFH